MVWVKVIGGTMIRLGLVFGFWYNADRVSFRVSVSFGTWLVLGLG